MERKLGTCLQRSYPYQVLYGIMSDDGNKDATWCQGKVFAEAFGIYLFALYEISDQSVLLYLICHTTRICEISLSAAFSTLLKE